MDLQQILFLGFKKKRLFNTTSYIEKHCTWPVRSTSRAVV